ncbi:hypothetical protein EVAR_74914_1 [Eumeta japonica]|uniref:Uncharacterized protein n=1 Tax=Eumeta variegata TaxID=151549 RepID=A0A4C1UJJ9_EUMVA|nr:hypothetical protein EVAR_74914_1 [Eumeta japonica]
MTQIQVGGLETYYPDHYRDTFPQRLLTNFATNMAGVALVDCRRAGRDEGRVCRQSAGACRSAMSGARARRLGLHYRFRPQAAPEPPAETPAPTSEPTPASDEEREGEWRASRPPSPPRADDVSEG